MSKIQKLDTHELLDFYTSKVEDSHYSPTGDNSDSPFSKNDLFDELVRRLDGFEKLSD